MKKNYLFMSGLLCLYAGSSPRHALAQTFAMNTPAQQVTYQDSGTYLTIQQILQSLETKHAIFFMFHTEKVKTVQVLYKPTSNESVQKTLDRILKPNGLDYKRHGKIYAIFPAGEGVKLKSTSGLNTPIDTPLSVETVNASVPGNPVTSEANKSRRR